MKSNDPIALSTKYRLLLSLLALVGVVFVLLSTSRYGAGISPDSVEYISTARNMIKGAGVTAYNGVPLVEFPPLYPTLLALIGTLFSADPLLLANIVNALIYGLIVYCGGLLNFKYLSSFPAFALVGTLAILFSTPLFAVSVMAYSEPLFILFVLLCLIFANSYLAKKDATSLLLLSSSVALSSLTRYIGVALILWGALVIIILRRDSLKGRIVHLSLFTLISTLPVGIWLIRNYAISSTFLGLRGSSSYTVLQNLYFVFNSLLHWYVPYRIAENRSTLVFVSVVTVLFAGLSLKNNWASLKVTLRQISPIVLFLITYLGFLIVSSATTAYETIGDRFLSPIYVPSTLLLLILAQVTVEPYRRRFSKKTVNSTLILGLVIWLTSPICTTLFEAIDLSQTGRQYSSKAWRESETVQYILEHRKVVSECMVYTNDPYAVYILAHLVVKESPSKTRYNSPELVNDISGLRGSWPEGSNASLVWFNTINRTYLFTIDELQTVADINQIVRLKDGAIFSVSRK